MQDSHLLLHRMDDACITITGMSSAVYNCIQYLLELLCSASALVQLQVKLQCLLVLSHSRNF